MIAKYIIFHVRGSNCRAYDPGFYAGGVVLQLKLGGQLEYLRKDVMQRGRDGGGTDERQQIIRVEEGVIEPATEGELRVIAVLVVPGTLGHKVGRVCFSRVDSGLEGVGSKLTYWKLFRMRPMGARSPSEGRPATETMSLILPAASSSAPQTARRPKRSSRLRVKAALLPAVSRGPAAFAGAARPRPVGGSCTTVVMRPAEVLFEAGERRRLARHLDRFVGEASAVGSAMGTEAVNTKRNAI